MDKVDVVKLTDEWLDERAASLAVSDRVGDPGALEGCVLAVFIAVESS